MKLLNFLNESLPKRLYHGTVGELVFKPGVLYLTPKKSAASVFGTDPFLTMGRVGKAHTYEIKAKYGQAKDINDIVENALMDDKDVDKVIEQEAAKARKGGYQYMKFSHGGEFDVIVSIYPDQDLEIVE